MNTVGRVPGENTSRQQEETPRISGSFDSRNGLARESVPYAQDDRVRREEERPPHSTGCPACRGFRDVGAASTHAQIQSHRAHTPCSPPLALVPEMAALISGILRAEALHRV
jgi:hypothetical protein